MNVCVCVCVCVCMYVYVLTDELDVIVDFLHVPILDEGEAVDGALPLEA